MANRSPKLSLRPKFGGGNKWSPKINWNKKQMLNNTIPQEIKTYKEGRGRKRPRPSLCVLRSWGIVLFSICFLFQLIFGDHLLPPRILVSSSILGGDSCAPASNPPYRGGLGARILERCFLAREFCSFFSFLKKLFFFYHLDDRIA